MGRHWFPKPALTVFDSPYPRQFDGKLIGFYWRMDGITACQSEKTLLLYLEPHGPWTVCDYKSRGEIEEVDPWV